MLSRRVERSSFLNNSFSCNRNKLRSFAQRLRSSSNSWNGSPSKKRARQKGISQQQTLHPPQVYSLSKLSHPTWIESHARLQSRQLAMAPWWLAQGFRLWQVSQSQIWISQNLLIQVGSRIPHW